MPRQKKQTEQVVAMGPLDGGSPTVGPIAPVQIPHIEIHERAMNAQDIIERRLALGDRAVLTTAKITLKTQREPMTLRWINTAITGRFWQVTNQMGWIPVPYEQVENAKQTADL